MKLDVSLKNLFRTACFFLLCFIVHLVIVKVFNVPESSFGSTVLGVFIIFALINVFVD